MTEIERLEAELHSTREELNRVRAIVAGDGAVRAAWSTFLAASPVAISVFDHALRIVKCSKQVTDLLGVTEAELVGRHIYDVMPYTRDLAPIHQRCLAGEAATLENWRVETPGGPVQFRLDLVPWFDTEGTIGGMVVVSYDTTDIVRAREAVRRSQQRLTLALEISESLVWEMSFRDRRLFATGAVSAIYDEIPTYKTLADDLLVAVHPDDRPRVETAWKAHVDHGRHFRTEYRINRRDGAEIWVDAVAETLRDETGAPDRVVGVLRNITQHKFDQIAVAHAREAAEAANRAKSEFLANMSHEIRTPLNGVMGVAGALARTPLAEDQRQMVDLIESSAQTLERLLTDILDLARIEAGRFEIKDEAFDLGEAVRSVAALFAPKAREKGVDFHLAIAAGCEGRFTGDAVRLRQILSNLLSNAVKFTEEGVVRLRAEPASDGSHIAFTVEDTGIGFDPAAKKRLFERFQQADGSITRRYGGSGLGLAISKSLAEHMGGALEAVSESGHGAAFTLTLALSRAESQPAASSPAAMENSALERRAPLAVDLPAPRVLLAEDHPTNRKVVELILGAAGVDLVSVVNGAEAVEAAAADRFDLILMDMQMPVMDGLTAIRAIRAKERAMGAPPTPILALTANAMPEHVRASTQAGASGHVTKPISATALLDAVAQACASTAYGEDASLAG